MSNPTVDPVSKDGLRPTEHEYRDWLESTTGVHWVDFEQESYLNTAERLRAEFETSPFWMSVVRRLQNLHAQSETETSYGLLAHPDQSPPIVKKSWDSLVLKSYRRNILDNPNWPDAPARGWTTPDNWFETVGDIVRSTVVVRYLDGVEVVRQAIVDVAGDFGVSTLVEYEAREDGYYALHLTATLSLSASSKAWQAVQLNIPVEIQICTQVQEVLRTLTHKFYVDRRRRPAVTDQKWQWNCHSEQFVPNYLGHILHYADGMIMNVRHQRESERYDAE